MTQRFVIALTREARRAERKIDLEKVLIERFQGVQVIERSIGGKSLTVEMPSALVRQLRMDLPFAVIEPEAGLSLL